MFCFFQARLLPLPLTTSIPSTCLGNALINHQPLGNPLTTSSPSHPSFFTVTGVYNVDCDRNHHRQRQGSLAILSMGDLTMFPCTTPSPTIGGYEWLRNEPCQIVTTSKRCRHYLLFPSIIEARTPKGNPWLVSHQETYLHPLSPPSAEGL